MLRVLAIALLLLVSIPSSWKATADDLPDAAGSVIDEKPEPVDCQSLHYDCHGCLANGCYWCPTDALCFETPKYVSKQTNKDILYPDRIHNCKTPESFTQTTCTAPGNFFSDPVYSAQKWIFDNIKVEPVWAKGYTGSGVRVRVNDAGIQPDHPEFLGRIDLNASCPVYEPDASKNSHGMIVASLVGATANNDNCGVGIAPGVTLSACHVGSMPKEALLLYKVDEIDISQNSWATEGCGPASISAASCNHPGCDRKLEAEAEAEAETSFCPFAYKPFESYNQFPCDHCNFTVGVPYSDQGEECRTMMINHCGFYPVQENKACMEIIDLLLFDKQPLSMGECHFGVLSADAIAAFTYGITKGRDGKGIVYVFAAGNEFAVGDDTNFQGYGSNTRFTIPVASVGKPGNFSAFSTPGASVFIAAPGGDSKQSITRVVGATVDGGCNDNGDGTSYAAPVVSGVVALMLEANPDLTWRDVQYILALTAQVVNDSTDPTVAENGAGKIHSNRYGFGIVNAEKAVELSEEWTNIGPELMLVKEGKGNVHLPDDVNNATKISLDFSHESKFITEHVYLYLNFNHSSRGHLRIDLSSPSGMLSVMSPGKRPESQQWGWMKFTSVRHWGEDPTGNWTIQIVDTNAGDVRNCISYKDYRIEVDEFSSLSCDGKDRTRLEQYCKNGKFDPNEEWAKACNNTDKKTADANLVSSCDFVERFKTEKNAGLTGPEACCICGGGFSPDLLPEELLEWKLVIYGHEKFPGEGFFSGVEGATELGKWKDRGRVYVEDRLRIPDDLDPLPGYQKPNSNVRRRGV